MRECKIDVTADQAEFVYAKAIDNSIKHSFAFTILLDVLRLPS